MADGLGPVAVPAVQDTEVFCRRGPGPRIGVLRSSLGERARLAAAARPYRCRKAFAGQFGVVLLYRGAWCPYCNAQLRAFQRASATLAEAGVQVVALSVDDEVATAGLIAKTA